jgi:hypothetical protein
MTSEDLLSLIAKNGITGGIVVVGLYFFGRVVMRVAERLIASIDRLGTKLEEHTAKDLEHHGKVRDAVVELSATMDTIMELTPVRGTRQLDEDTPVDRPQKRRARTNPFGTPTVYSEVKRRHTTRDDDD